MLSEDIIVGAVLFHIHDFVKTLSFLDESIVGRSKLFVCLI